MIEDREQRARIKALGAVGRRLGAAQGELASASEKQALDDASDWDKNVSIAHLANCESQLHGALALLQDSRRSLTGERPSAEHEGADRMVEYLARMWWAIEDFLKAEVAGTPRDGLPFGKLDEARILPPDLFAAIQNRGVDT